MIYKCNYCGEIIDPVRLHIEDEIPSECPYCGRSDYQDFRSGISAPAVRIATKEEVASYEDSLHRSSEELEERTSFFEELVASNKKKIRQAFGNRQAQNFEKHMRKDIESTLYDNMDLNDWKSFLQEMVSLYSYALVKSSIKYTPKKYRRPWTKERIDNIASICDMDEWEISSLYQETGIKVSDQGKHSLVGRTAHYHRTV